MHRFRERPLAALLALAGTMVMPAQDRPVADPVQQQAMALVDRFHAVMPRNPAELGQAKVRDAIAKAAVPVLREIRAFAAAHPRSPFEGRVLEFVVYGVVLGDDEVVGPLRERSRRGDASSRFLLECGALIVAADGKQRAAAVEALALTLRERTQPAATEATVCGSACLTMAADLSEAEARTLANSAVDATVAKRFAAVAEAAAKDPRRRIGQPFEVAGRVLSGEPFSTTALRGKVVLVDFWATWCGPCVKALPEIVAAKQRHGPGGLVVVGVSCDREVAALRKFLAEHPEVDWPQLFEPGLVGFHPLAVSAGLTAIPRLFLIDKKGVLRSVDAHAQLDEMIVRLLAE